MHGLQLRTITECLCPDAIDLVRKGKGVKSTLCKATIAQSLDLRAGGESQLLQIAECTCRRRDGLIEVYSRDTVVISDTIINKECELKKPSN